jgi:hypothetical protein
VVEEALHVAATAHADYPKRPNPRWTMTLWYAVNIYRGEVAKVRAAQNWRIAERAREQARAAKRPLDEDDED